VVSEDDVFTFRLIYGSFPSAILGLASNCKDFPQIALSQPVRCFDDSPILPLPGRCSTVKVDNGHVRPIDENSEDDCPIFRQRVEDKRQRYEVVLEAEDYRPLPTSVPT
jgi:hypothetical protein